MTFSEEQIFGFFKDDSSVLNLSSFSVQELGEVYIGAAMMCSISEFIKEENWLKIKHSGEFENEGSYNAFNKFLFTKIDLSMSFLENLFTVKEVKGQKNRLKKSEELVRLSLLEIEKRDIKEVKVFLKFVLNKMRLLFKFEEGVKSKKLEKGEQRQRGARLYRSFDGLDRLFKLNYSDEKIIEGDAPSSERLYAGAGAGVQSGYSTILLALDHLEPKDGSKIIDLGSGYGRVGLVCALLWPKIKFTGFEFVPHRVELANSISKELNLSDQLEFKVQDLSLQSFKIPQADIYYLYDPFTEDTYRYVLDQILELAKKQSITVVSKGNSGIKFLEMAADNECPSPVILDDGNLTIFRSRF